MRLLLDSHTLLWALADDPRLGERAKAAIADAANLVAVSAATVWEVSVKRALGKVEAPEDLLAQLAEARFFPLAITLDHAHAAGALPRHHDDPFDRMLVAQARAERLTIVTRDPAIARYGIAVLAA